MSVTKSFSRITLNQQLASLLPPAGSSSGFHPKASGFVLYKERAELAGRPDARGQEKEEDEREGELSNEVLSRRCVFDLADTRHLLQELMLEDDGTNTTFAER